MTDRLAALPALSLLFGVVASGCGTPCLDDRCTQTHPYVAHGNPPPPNGPRYGGPPPTGPMSPAGPPPGPMAPGPATAPPVVAGPPPGPAPSSGGQMPAGTQPFTPAGSPPPVGAAANVPLAPVPQAGAPQAALPANYKAEPRSVEAAGKSTGVRWDWEYDNGTATSRAPTLVLRFWNGGKTNVRFSFRAYSHEIQSCNIPADDAVSRTFTGDAILPPGKGLESPIDNYREALPKRIWICVWGYGEN